MTSYQSKEQLDTKDGEAQLLPKWVNEASKDKDNVWHQSGGLLSMHDLHSIEHIATMSNDDKEKQVMFKKGVFRVETLPKWVNK